MKSQVRKEESFAWTWLLKIRLSRSDLSLITPTENALEHLVKAVTTPKVEAAKNVAFSWIEVRDCRPANTKLFAIISDASQIDPAVESSFQLLRHHADSLVKPRRLRGGAEGVAWAFCPSFLAASAEAAAREWLWIRNAFPSLPGPSFRPPRKRGRRREPPSGAPAGAFLARDTFGGCSPMRPLFSSIERQEPGA